jgi:hypothetical protein
MASRSPDSTACCGALRLASTTLSRLLFDHRGDFGKRRTDRQHRAAIAVAFGHQAAAQPRQPMQRFRVVPARRVQRHQFAVAVPGHHVRPQAEAPQHAQQAQADRTKRWLGNVLGSRQRRRLVFAFAFREGMRREDQIAQALT